MAAPEIAKQYSQQIVETEHLMKALLEQPNGMVRRVVTKADANPTALLDATESFISKQPRVSGDSSQAGSLHLPLHPARHPCPQHAPPLGNSFIATQLHCCHGSCCFSQVDSVAGTHNLTFNRISAIVVGQHSAVEPA